MSSKVLGPFAALIFDQDGTLLDAESMHCAAWCKVASDLKVEFHEKIFAAFAGKGDISIAEHVADQTQGAIVTELVEQKREYYREHLDEIPLIPGALSFLEKVKAAKLPMAIATISPAEETMRVVAKKGLAPFFSAIVHCESEVPGRPGQVVRAKPEPDIYLAAAARLNVAPERCCAFEDSLTGLTAAKNANMSAVVIPTCYSKHFDFSKADALTTSFGQIKVDSKGMIAVDCDKPEIS
ncbi:MAG: HAD family phosphatase [Pseudomonadota bacterium]